MGKRQMGFLDLNNSDGNVGGSTLTEDSTTGAGTEPKDGPTSIDDKVKKYIEENRALTDGIGAEVKRYIELNSLLGYVSALSFLDQISRNPQVDPRAWYGMVISEILCKVEETYEKVTWDRGTYDARPTIIADDPEAKALLDLAYTCGDRINHYERPKYA